MGCIYDTSPHFGLDKQELYQEMKSCTLTLSIDTEVWSSIFTVKNLTLLLLYGCFMPRHNVFLQECPEKLKSWVGYKSWLFSQNF